MKLKTLPILLFCISLAFTESLLYPPDCDSACVTCFGKDNPNFCFECKPSYIWQDYKCTLFDSRKIPGVNRPCVQCGPYNYVTSDYKCKACPFPCITCDAAGCFTCKTELGFALNVATKKCECLKGYFKDGKCLCQDDLHYVDKDGNCVECKKGTRGIGNCFPPCPKNTYEITVNQCEPCHYSCGVCYGKEDTECEPPVIPGDNTDGCRHDLGFEYMSSEKRCMCICNSYEQDEACHCSEGYTENLVNKVMTCTK